VRAQVGRVIRQELGAPADLVFAEFEQQATAAASLAQVGGRAVGCT
jgi:predicted unusual protein kinase regulating ubiquinone biosynthesis (AarF/ABC1/UbiB family)